MKRKFFFSLLALTLSVATWAAVGPQSIKVTFNGNDSEGWQASSGGSITSVADGVANVQMAMQYDKNNVCLNKYRADFQYQTSGTYTFDKTKDIVWAIKLTAPLPGTANSRKFELNYKNSENANTWINGINGPSGQIDCVDGGRIYYFNLGADGLNKLNDVQDGDVTINNIHFIFADAVVGDAADAHYSVDWVATFSSVDDLKDFADRNDDAEQNLALPYLEMMFRLSNSSSYDNNYSKSGFTYDNLEGNYHASIFTIEYFLIENFNIRNTYTLKLVPSATNNDPIGVWNFPYLVSHGTAASDMYSYASTVVGIAPGSADNTGANTPIAIASCVNSKWELTLHATDLTTLGTIDGKTLVGVLITTNNLLSGGGSKFTTSSHATTKPSFEYTSSAPIVNETQQIVYSDLAVAASAANAGDVITLYDDVTISGSRLEIKKELTIQGATGAEKIICGVAWNCLMVLASDNEAEYTVTFRNLIVDGQNTVRDRQLFDTNNKAKMAFHDVTVINTAYSVVTGDVKCAGYGILLSGTNSFPNGIYLNRDKRIDNQYATTHTEPIKIILSGDYRENYAIVLRCDDASLFKAEDATGTCDWELSVVQAGVNKELQGTKITALTLADDADNATALTTYDGQTANVTISRSITANGTDYATFCAPFAIDAETVAEQLGNPDILRYSHTEISGDEATFYFTDADAIEAGVPYLIKPEDGAVLDLKFRHVTIDNTLNETTDGVYSFVPVFSPTTIADASDATAKSVIFLSSGNQLKWASADASLKGMRAYFRQVAATPSPIMRMRIGTHGTATDAEQTIVKKPAEGKQLINGALIIEHEGRLYNAQGQQIQ